MTQAGNRLSVGLDTLARFDVGLLPRPFVAPDLDFVIDGSSQDLVQSSQDARRRGSVINTVIKQKAYSHHAFAVERPIRQY
jgi:hypothetical protein